MHEAIALDKDIYVFPHLYRSEQGMGCNKLIADGAQILYDTIQIKEMIPKKMIEKSEFFGYSWKRILHKEELT